ncbi:caspase family protein [Coleofasciculus sp. FACHB-129]|uniref:caspase family protein n=1 Tax=Cyanophyceae TaxID=3028117 RepID=UPI001684B4EF|nr:caspase family protein [Coleofasciculus sp. FACHB-129]MBD1893194.1 caspase family protein [Coleofasciculus sp. FACHB-129]
MPNQNDSDSNIHALLIGIDNYSSTSLFKSLEGAVRDINLVEAFLKNTLKLPTERIRRLIAPNREDTVLLVARSAHEPEPTYKNIVKAFTELTEAAQPGEQIYIHYSGHGGRATTIYSDLKGEGQSDEGIVPMDIGQPDGRYLRDVELATLLKRMTDKGLVVTVILDSCHSGGTTRGDYAIRSSGETDTAIRPRESLVGSREELINNWRSLTEGTHRTTWIPESRDYVVLAACRPTESAYEYSVNGKERHGALTYWMLDTLNTLSGTLTYKVLHDRVGAKIQSKFPSQLPMLLGEGDRAIFGTNRISTYYTVTVLQVDNSQQQVKLNAGLANGLDRGTRFAIFPFNTADFADKQKQVAIVEVTDIEASSATARVLAEVEGGIGVKGQIEPGAPALLLAAPTDLVRRVRFHAQKQLGKAENELPTQTLVAQQKEALDAVRQALVGNGWVIEAKSGEEGHYQIALGRNGEYEICIGMPIKNLNPPLMFGDSTAPKEVVQRLIHLAKYQSVQELDNPASELIDALEFVLLDQNRQPFPNSSNISLKDGTKAYLRAKNTASQTLNVAVLDLEPTWEISQIPFRGIDAAFYELAPQETVDIPLRFTAPKGAAYQQAKEILKLFATRGSADFRWLRLPPLDHPIKKRHEATRGIQNAFGKLLEAVGADPSVAPVITRAAVYVPDSNADWVTKQIQVTIG